ncbi:S9 family peptidase [Gimibacter soli]|uniref:S9 family peptidase n=1 Tax=Gimibacter soli TaxID=3024400 RepID=A0AAE9XLB2_9PROT|nr:S9 family peptidase [Gimibacter soli]WCL53269.1 S9 family peptidase [Gimibacter soli]
MSFRTSLIAALIAATPLPLAAVHAEDAATARPAAEGGPIKPLDIMSLQSPVDLALSNDGSLVAFAVLPQMSTFFTPSSDIWIARADGATPARPFIIAKGANRTPRWSPDDKLIAFLSNRANPLASEDDKCEGLQIWALAVSGGEAAPLTCAPQGVNDFRWSPDGSRIAFTSGDAASVDEARLSDAIVADAPRPLSRLWLLDLADGKTERVSPEGLNVADMQWSPNGKTLSLRVTDKPGLNAYFYHSYMVLMDAGSGKVTGTPVKTMASGGYWSPDGKRIAYLDLLKDGADRPLTGGISTGIRVLDLATGKIDRFGDDYPGFLLHPHWAKGGKVVEAMSFEKTRSNIISIDPATGTIKTVAAFDGELTDTATNARGDMAAIGNTPTRPGEVWKLDGKAFTALTDLNPDVDNWKLGKVEEISWQSSLDGRTIYGVLITPPGYKPGSPIKTVTQLHGGPEWAWWSGWMGSWHEWGQMLASHGYAVFLPNPRGSDGQGAAFARLAIGDWGGGDYQDVLDGVNHLIARKIADPEKLGIGGWSYGGYLSAWAVTHGGPFKTAIVGAAPTDLLAMLQTTDTPDFVLDYYGSAADNPTAYDAASPVRRLDKVTVPVLILHNEADVRVPVDIGRQFYGGLKLLGKEAAMVTYPREPHWMGEADHQLDIQERVLDWFERYIH